jgi:hypothetical protein
LFSEQQFHLESMSLLIYLHFPFHTIHVPHMHENFG